jgi:hypothetical protein
MVTAVMVVVTLVEPPTPMATMMAVAGLLDRRTSFACGRQLAENVTGGGRSLGAADCNNAGKSARDGSEGEESSHVSSFFYSLCTAACIFAVQQRTQVDPPDQIHAQVRGQRLNLT